MVAVEVSSRSRVEMESGLWELSITRRNTSPGLQKAPCVKESAVGVCVRLVAWSGCPNSHG